ncbi:MAG: hypothetical protein IKK65_02830 [Clostridia bacterium]|nr:hypothetical protein [Clostridia bacterium]
MKKLFSLLLSAILLLSVAFVPTASVSALTETGTTGEIITDGTLVLTNTFDEDAWSTQPNSDTLKTTKDDGGNGYVLQFNKITSLNNPVDGVIRHYKIYNPVKVLDGYANYKPSTNTTYKLTFRYRTKSLNDFDIYINVRGVTNGIVGDVLTRAATIKKTLVTTTYIWDTAVAYFTTPVDALEALAISVEYSNTKTGSESWNVAIDDVKLETAPSSFVVANTFEEDDVYSFGIDDTNINGTINSGEDKSICIQNSYNMNTTTYSNTSMFGTTNAFTARTNNTLGFRALRKISAANKVHYEIYDYSKGIENNKLKSFVPDVDTNYKITFDYKVKSYSNEIRFTIRPVTVSEGERTLGDAIGTYYSIPAKDSNHQEHVWKTASVVISTATSVDGLALTIETPDNEASSYLYLDNVTVYKEIIEEEGIFGDINSDETVDICDLVALYIAESTDAKVTNTTDLNKDGLLTTEDLSILRQILLGTFSDVTVNSRKGVDCITNDGAVFCNLRTAFEVVADNGTVNVEGDYKVAKADELNTYGKKVTLTGDSVDFSAFSTVKLFGDITFDNITVAFKDDSLVYANGNSVCINENVIVTGTPAEIYGGSFCDEIDSTDLRVLSGNYKKIYGGSNGFDVNGDTSLFVGGNVNSNIDVSNHELYSYYIYGGGKGGTVSNTKVTVADNARGLVAYGGGEGGTVLGKTNLVFSGGALMGIYGGSTNGTCSNTNITVTGGTVEQIFGGSENAAIIGSTNITLDGGTVTRRIYGGCYNSYGTSGWSTDRYVNGTCTINITERLTFNKNSADFFDDAGITAQSRCGKNHSDEIAILTFDSPKTKEGLSDFLGLYVGFTYISECD